MESKRGNNLHRLEQKNLILKFLLIGDYGVGKTAIARRYTDGKFSSNYKLTVGAEFSMKVIRWDANTIVNIQLWDIAGQERFGYMTRVYYKNAVGCAIVFDISRLSSYNSVVKWLKDLRKKVVFDDGRDIPVILLANKWDIGECCACDEAINKLCREVGLSTWFKISAKENLNIDKAMNYLIEEVLNTWIEKSETSETNCIDLLQSDKPKENSCCK
ncbi:ras-related protein Rab-32-like [Cimex lectularius]|uniref:Ras-related protein Rab n=1 Tax=Cimex lectularius TaxID=79782 RepID=A0A8I6TJJ2_CIMLE|nr:ras-related protein Rab-32-like [Cimex lectularius]